MTDERPPLLTVVTFNVSMDLVGHPLVPEWDRRKRACLDVLRHATADAIGLQETSPSQLAFLVSGLPEFDVWTHRVTLPTDLLNDLRSRFGPRVPSEFAEVVLLTRRATVAVEAFDHWWLSPAPERELSLGFGNVTPRLAVRTSAIHRPSGLPMTLATTHIDHRAALPMTVLFARRARNDGAARSTVIFGDLNTHPDRRGYEQLIGDGWHDAYEAAEVRGVVREIPTFIDDGGTFAGQRVDHVLYRSTHLRAVEWATLGSHPGELSDHAPVLARFEVARATTAADR